MALTQDKFFEQFSSYFSTSSRSKAVFLSIKRYKSSHRDKENEIITDSEKSSTEAIPMFLFRASLGNKKISTIVSFERMSAFHQALTSIVKNKLVTNKKIQITVEKSS